jgi:hypothetical protein
MGARLSTEEGRDRDSAHEPGDAQSLGEAIDRPGRVLRIGTMTRQILEELRQTALDEPSRSRVEKLYGVTIRELSGGLSPDLGEELRRVAPAFSEGHPPSEPELRIAHAQLTGWLEGLFQGLQSALVAQPAPGRPGDEFTRQATDGAEQAAGRGTYL